jgi:hypothetical protein
MSLKTTYLDGANGFTQKMTAVFAAGQDLVLNSNSLLESELELNASKGQKKFTVNIQVLFEPDNLRLNGIHQQTFFAGVSSQLMLEDIYDYEFSLKLNVSDQISTSIDILFKF